MIISLETATRRQCSVALHSTLNGQLLFEKVFLQTDNHLESISEGIEAIFQSFDRFDIRAIAVSAGPGSYTGLRIGVSMAKALGYTFKIPLLAINTLQAMAHQIIAEYPLFEGYICPMLDARRNEVYTALFDSQCKEVISAHAHVLQNDSFSSFKSSPILFIGSGALKAQNILTGLHQAIFQPEVFPQARYVGNIALKAYSKKEFVDLAYFEPFYLKDFIGKKS